MEGADAVYPASASALARGRRVRRAAAARASGAASELRARRRTVPVTFAEIKEVDEENAELGAGAPESGACERRGRRPDVLDERLGAGAARARRRAHAHALRELSPPARAGSEPASPRHAAAPCDADT